MHVCFKNVLGIDCICEVTRLTLFVTEEMNHKIEHIPHSFLSDEDWIITTAIGSRVHVMKKEWWNEH